MRTLGLTIFPTPATGFATNCNWTDATLQNYAGCRWDVKQATVAITRISVE